MNNAEHPGLYVHIPFCGTKCPYCDFYSLTSLSLVPQWLEALKKEAIYYRGRFRTFDSLFLGGGTPSLIEDRHLSDLMACLLDCFSFSPDSECTLEANPDDITPSRATLLRDLGFNRISLGVQSFNDTELRILKRRHSAKQAERAIETLKQAGFANIGLDLMYGLPGRTESDWSWTLNRALAFEPAHLSCYQLTIAEKTPFGRMLEQGLIDPLKEEEERALFLLTSERLTENGYLHYEVSNFARIDRVMCRHNLKYWRRVPYLGLGPSAHSFSNERRWWNVRSLAAYFRVLSEGRAPLGGSEDLTPAQQRMESLLLGFRTREGVETTFVARPDDRKAIRECFQSGLITREGDRIIPTREGYLVADSLPLLFS